ncbi:MAG: EAL domain-containing protein [Zoogloea sp.]|nr:EAL domain-containing protein [Zoogloea sp.]
MSSSQSSSPPACGSSPTGNGRPAGDVGGVAQARPVALQDIGSLVNGYQTAAERLRRVMEAINDGFWDWDLDRDSIFWSPCSFSMLGYAPDAFTLNLAGWKELVHSDDLPEVLRQIDIALDSGAPFSVDFRYRRLDGSWLWVQGRGRVMDRDETGRPVRVMGTHTDITERRQTEERLRASESSLRLAASVFRFTHEAIMITDANSRIVDVNDTFLRISGYQREEVMGCNPRFLKSGRHPSSFYAAMRGSLSDAGHWRGELWNRRKSGEVFAAVASISAVRDESGEVTHYVGLLSDITALKQSQQRLEQMAYYDALTQLPNRSLLSDRLHLAIAHARRSGNLLAVCYLDLDGFKPVNDTHGHAAGDRLLVDVAARLTGCVRAADTIARLGGDEFVVLLNHLRGVEECEHALDRIVSAMAVPHRVDSELMTVSASLGVTLFPQDDSDPDTLLRHADQAMYVAKQSGRNRYHLFDPENDRRLQARRKLHSRLESALEADELHLYYQPKVNMRSSEVLGAEALLRWQHPKHGLLAPSEFLPAVENTEFAVTLGEWVLDRAMGQIEAWAAEGVRLPVSVNLFAVQLQDERFVDRLKGLLERHPAVRPGDLEVEILETSALEDVTVVSRIIEECGRLGVRFALDDFGTGSSSLAYFRQLPAQVLKIDRSFVRDMLQDPDDLAIVKGVIALTRAFRREVIAEGVESVEHGAMLLSMGCEFGQGYGICRPMPPHELPVWLDKFRSSRQWSGGRYLN